MTESAPRTLVEDSPDYVGIPVTDNDVDKFIVMGEFTPSGRTDVIMCGAPTDRPHFTAPASQYLNAYAYVKGTMRSSPLDLADRMNQVYAKLKSLGWLIGAPSIVTDFGLIPLPKTQPFSLLMHRKDRPYTPQEAQEALNVVLASMGLEYSATGAWAGEVMSNVVVPTVLQAVEQAKTAVTSTATGISKLVPWIAVGAVALAAVYVMQFIPKPRRT